MLRRIDIRRWYPKDDQDVICDDFVVVTCAECHETKCWAICVALIYRGVPISYGEEHNELNNSDPSVQYTFKSPEEWFKELENCVNILVVERINEIFAVNGVPEREPEEVYRHILSGFTPNDFSDENWGNYEKKNTSGGKASGYTGSVS